MEESNPKILCFYCSFGWGYAGNVPEGEVPGVRMIPVTCSSKVDSMYVLEALKKGADGVVILGCPEGRCHFEDGNFRTEKKVILLRRILQAFGLSAERLRMVLGKDPEGTSISDRMNDIRASLARHLEVHTEGGKGHERET